MVATRAVEITSRVLYLRFDFPKIQTEDIEPDVIATALVATALLATPKKVFLLGWVTNLAQEPDPDPPFNKNKHCDRPPELVIIRAPLVSLLQAYRYDI